MRLLPVLLLGAALLYCAETSIILKGACYPCADEETCCDGARAVDESGRRDEGNIWQPAEDGSNILRCGDNYIPRPKDRLVVEVGTGFKIHFQIVQARGGGEVKLTLKYGENPNFYVGQPFGVDSMELQNATDDSGWVISTSITEAIGYNGTGTIQVAYIPREKTVTSQGPLQLSYFQCIDIVSLGGQMLPEGDYPWGFGDPEFDQDKDTDFGARSFGPDLDDDGLTDFQIVIIVLCVLLALVFICIYIKYKAGQGADVKEEAEPQMALTEQVQEAPPEPKEKEIVLEPQSEPEPDPPKSEPEPEMDIEANKPVEQPAQDQDGSSGRHFHFRYVSDDDDK